MSTFSQFWPSSVADSCPSFGLSYTTFELSKLTFAQAAKDGAFGADFTVTVRNTGAVAGSEVVQLYITLPSIGLTTPELQLRGFGKAKDVQPGASVDLTISLDRYAVSYWDAVHSVWAATAGE